MWDRILRDPMFSLPPGVGICATPGRTSLTRDIGALRTCSTTQQQQPSASEHVADGTDRACYTPTELSHGCAQEHTALMDDQSQSLIVPSHEQVATLEGSKGCQMAEMQTWSWHLILRKTLQLFQSQNQRRPSVSPDMT